MTAHMRAATRDDLPAMLQLIGQPDMDGESDLTLEKGEELFRQIDANPAHTLYVAEDSGAVVGMFALIIVQHLSHNGAHSAIIEDVVVRSDRQGQGIGQDMMRFAIDAMRAAGCYKVMLSSGAKRIRAHAFYEQLGFERHGQSFLIRFD